MKCSLSQISITISLLFLMSCAINKEVKTEDISSNGWELEELTGFSNEIKGPNGFPTLVFNLADSTYTGTSGCNSFRGKFELDEDNIKLLPGISTKRYCNNNGLEEAYFTTLNTVNRYRIFEEKLILFNNDEKLAIFRNVRVK